MERLPKNSNAVKGPVRNDRVALNALRHVRLLVDLPTASDEDKYILLSTISYFIGGMEYSQGHADVAREWRKLVTDLFPRSDHLGGHHKYQWIDEAILKQKGN